MGVTRDYGAEVTGESEDNAMRLTAVGNHDLFIPIRAERDKHVLGIDVIAESKLVVGVHQNGVHPQSRLIRPANRRKSYRQGFRLPWNMQMQLEHIPGL